MKDAIATCPVNLEDALARAGDDRDFFKELLELFISDVDDRLRDLQQAAESGDVGQVRSIAHSLKGAAANLSAEDVRQAAWEIESRSRSGDISGLGPLVVTLRGEVKRLIDFARTF